MQIWLTGLFLSLPLFFVVTKQTLEGRPEFKVYSSQYLTAATAITSLILASAWFLTVPMCLRQLLRAIKAVFK